MIDYTKINNLPVSVEKIVANEQLNLPLSNVAAFTGEILNRAQVAHFGKMDFVVKNGYVKLKGSYHKHAQDGPNYRDFSFSDIQIVIEELANTFQFDPKNARFNFIEIGVNLEVSVDPTSLIKNFLLYKNKEFENLPITGKGYGKQCRMQRLTIKVYNKSLQNGLPYHLLRFEVKVTRMQYLKQFGIYNLTMDDLKKPEIYSLFRKMLLHVFNQILFSNPDFNVDSILSTKDRDLVSLGRYSEYWKELPRQRKSEQIRRFVELTGANNIMNELAELISSKWDKLMDTDKITTFKSKKLKDVADKITTSQISTKKIKPDKITTFIQHQLTGDKKKTGRINTTINGYSKSCPITNIDISMQKENSVLLSNTGLTWLLQNDYFKYEEVRKRFLPRRGVSGLHTKFEGDEINHLSKQIRNENYNRRKFRLKISDNQLSILRNCQ